MKISHNHFSHKQATSLFRRLFTENLVGTILFESAKIAHNLALFAIMPRADYGTMGLIFSITYLTTSLSDLGWTPTLPVFIRQMTDSKESVRTRLKPYILSQLPILLIAAVIGGLIASATAPSLTFIVGTLIVTEGLRNFLRTFLHTLTINRSTIAIELFSTFLFMGLLWLPLIFEAGTPTTHSIFKLFLITSCFAVTGLIAIALRAYRSLPPINQEVQLAWSWKTLLEVRAANAANASLKQTMTGNFIVAALAASLSVEALAPIKCAAYVADSIRAFLKTTVGFSGAALLAQLRTAPQEFKRKIFTTISEGYVDTIPPLLLFIVVSKHYLGAISSSATQATLSATLVVLGILEHLFFVYEQFYIVEKSALVVATIRIAEIAACLYVLLNTQPGSFAPTTALIVILSLRCASTIILMIDGYLRYRLLPALPSTRVIGSWLIIILTIIVSEFIR